MALLHLVRVPGTCLSRGVRAPFTRGPAGPAVAIGLLTLFALGCEPTDPALVPDDVLQAEFGLTERDRVYTVSVTTGVGERASPDTIRVSPGDFVQFVSGDHFVHEVRFQLDALTDAQQSFLVDSGQDASPPLVRQGARFVLTLEEAPPGSYPFALEGNRAPGAGVLVVRGPDDP